VVGVTDIAIELEPDPAQDDLARRAALALIVAGHDEDEDVVHQRSSAALHDLVAMVVGPVEVRPESAPALSAMLSTAARQYTAFGALAYVIADQAFAAGQRSPAADGPDHGEILAATAEVLERLAEDGV
jgi:hypothetical protein